MNIQELTIARLESQILHHKQAYYSGRAEISDSEYDGLEDHLKKLKPDSPVLQIVGTPYLTDKKIPHTTPMLSLDKCKDAKSVLKWMGEDGCVVTFKLDGSSASLVYQNGVLKVGKTRGDGSHGENITNHVSLMDIPLAVKEFKDHSEVEVRGEICLAKERFEPLCIEMENRKLDRPKSIRNIVAGLLHRETDIDLCAHLEFIAYEVIGVDDLVPVSFDPPLFKKTIRGFSTSGTYVPASIEYEKPVLDNLFEMDKTFYFDRLVLLGRCGFRIPAPFGVPPTLEAVEAMITYYQDALDRFDYLCDGLVFAIDDIETQESRGYTDHHPKGKMAFKLASEVKTTVVKDIIVDVGRTGQLSFVGIVEPVELSGAMVEKVTLHNLKYLKDHRINIGAKIEITRSGEVIPKHVRTIEYGTQDITYIPPIVCPICDTPLKKTRVNLVCNNSVCPSKMKAAILHWIDVLKIYDIGDTTVEKLWDRGLVKTVEDLYNLNPADLAGIDKLGKKSALKIFQNIQNTKTVHIEKLLTALGVEGLGKGVSKLLIRNFSSLEEMQQATIDQLQSIDGIGSVIAENIVSGLKTHKEFLAKMNFDIQYPDTSASELEGKSFVITGALSKPRPEIQAWIEQKGGRVVGSVSKKTSYLVCNQASNSSKYRKATELGIEIITEEQLYTM